jgi:hypothetical protein
MIIARNQVISNTKYLSHLPPSWGTLYTLTTVDKKLGDGALQKLLMDGTINAKTERKDVTASAAA